MSVFARIAAALLVVALGVAGCASSPPWDNDGGSWMTLIDNGSGLDNFDRIGDANWRTEGGAIVADDGKGGHLVSRRVYGDFQIRAEFWAAPDTNSGIFIRSADNKKIGSATSYEINIWDIRPDPKYGTGAIVNFAAVPVPITNLAGNRWNRMEITAQGTRLIVKLNGQTTVDINDGKFKAGYFSLQYGAGVKGARGGPIKWRTVQVRTL
ncbi:MAG: DUF1080 domain-containing protein [Betaproteobacteria bacterium]|nr:DUF1080 domain-containing protein [Betaproteobacteria bacterium]